jgi:putative tricarboxylic transport membrane protein
VTDRIVFVFTVLLAAVYLYATSQLRSYEFGDPLGPKTFPFLLGIGLLISAAMLVAEMWRARKIAGDRQPAAQTDGASHAWVITAVAAWTLVYFMAFGAAGYVLATMIYLLVLTSYFNRGKWLANSLTSVLYSVLSYLMFTRLLGVRLPAGILPF